MRLISVVARHCEACIRLCVAESYVRIRPIGALSEEEMSILALSNRICCMLRTFDFSWEVRMTLTTSATYGRFILPSRGGRYPSGALLLTSYLAASCKIPNFHDH